MERHEIMSLAFKMFFVGTIIGAFIFLAVIW